MAALRLFDRVLPAGAAAAPLGALVLPFDERCKARQRARLVCGTEVGIDLPRGTVLRGGDRLGAADGTAIEVIAAPEPVSTVVCADARALARAAYHLGNRHGAVEIAPNRIRYRADHVLDRMIAALGLAVVHEQAPFEPEPGAYAGHAHGAAGPAHGAGHGADGHDHGHGDAADARR